MHKFKLRSKFKPAGDQPQAIKQLVAGLKNNLKKQTLLGVTGSGKTFTIANVIESVQKPTLVISHNKTLAAQLTNEFREFFPDNAVEYFVSYYDYYQPEAYLPITDTYIEKEAQINEEIDRLRHASTTALLSRPDVIIVASVSAIYGLGSPEEYKKMLLHFKLGQPFGRHELLEQFINMQFERTPDVLRRGKFRLRGQTLEVMPADQDVIYRFEITDKIENIQVLDPVSRKIKDEPQQVWFFPAKHYVLNPDARQLAFKTIRAELKDRLAYFKRKNKILEYERLKRKTNYDLEMIKNIGYCSGIENYSRHFDAREPGQPPFTLLDYFKQNNQNFLTVIDESHVTLPQIRGMYNGDKSRKDTLIQHGFRLPSARDNRPLKYYEFAKKIDQVIYMSATPAEEEITQSNQIVEQIARPTGLVDPELIIKPVSGKISQVDDLMTRISQKIKQKEKILVTTLTKRMAEDLADYLAKRKILVKYLHSEINALERIEIITDLRGNKIDVIVGVNLLREGLDIPEVSLVAILDADKEGFLRNETSLIQTIGRAARNVNGQVVIYADKITGSIKQAVTETDRRRKIQLAYNKKHDITPKTIQKNIRNILEEFGISTSKRAAKKRGAERSQKILELELEADTRPVQEIIKEKETRMKRAAKELQFELAAILRDEIRELKKKLT
jgi:excinuclease ABC subunit B